MTKFNVGDIVRGNSNFYGLTNYSMTKGIVTGILSDFGAIKVKRLEKDGRPVADSCEYPVEEKYFTLVERAKPTPKHAFSKGDKIRVRVTKSAFGKVIDTTQPHTFMGEYQGQASINAPGETISIGMMLVPMSAIEPWEPPFKVGDKVRALPSSDKKYSFTNSKMTLGEVVEVDPDHFGNKTILVKIRKHEIATNVGDTYWVEPQYFELVVEDEKPNFQVGDKLRGLKTGLENGYVITNAAGTILEVVEIDAARGKESIRVKVLEHHESDWVGTLYWVDPQYFELFEQPKSSFKVGDRIRGLPSSDKEYSITTTKMTLGEVLETNPGSMRIKVLGHEHTPWIGRTYAVEPQHFTLVEEVKKPTTPFVVGDLVCGLSDELQYFVTNKYMTLAEVTGIDGETMSVKVLAHEKRSDLVGRTYDHLRTKYFAKVEPSKSVKAGDKVRSLTGRSTTGLLVPTSVGLTVAKVGSCYVDVAVPGRIGYNSLDNGTFVVVSSAPVKTELQLAQERITALETELTSTKAQLVNAQRKLERIESLL